MKSDPDRAAPRRRAQGDAQDGHGRLIGGLTVLAALALNKWSIERIVAADEHIRSTAPIVMIVAGQIALALVGTWLLYRTPRALGPRPLQRLTVVVLAVAVAAGAFGALKALHIIDPSSELRLAWQEIIANEELLLALTPRLQEMSTSALNLGIPDVRTRGLFADEVAVRDIADTDAPLAVASGAGDTADVAILPAGIRVRSWPVDAVRRSVSRDHLHLLGPLLDRVAYLERPKFFFVTGRFTDPGHLAYESDVGLQALAHLDTGELVHVAATQTLRWEPGADRDAAESWQITSWDVKEVTLRSATRRMFEESLGTALATEDLQRARRSIHEELVLESLIRPDEFEKPHDFFSLPAFDRHPGVAVVDINDDLYDDVYVMARWGRNMLLVNQRDGTFVEAASAYGLDLEAHSSSAIFADFDNDGDADVFIGGTLARTRYLLNSNGRFTDVSASHVDVPLPYFVSSVSAVDYDGDGLLDVYLSTYAADTMWQPNDSDFYATYFNDTDAAELKRRERDPETHVNLRRLGPPNVLLRNAGDGHFTPAVAPELDIWLNTYQSTWADYDRDGDADVYVVNDFAPNNLLRNDGGGHFTDVTGETGTSDIGFGMGATWGDYDLDGAQDLYVSNMYSKAGRRITAQVQGLDPRFEKMARGNSLFRNRGGVFDKVSDLAAPSLLVESAGWSWGSQFGDVNNDGLLDIYALSGYYTAPGEAEIPVDT